MVGNALGQTNHNCSFTSTTQGASPLTLHAVSTFSRNPRTVLTDLERILAVKLSVEGFLRFDDVQSIPSNRILSRPVGDARERHEVLRNECLNAVPRHPRRVSAGNRSLISGLREGKLTFWNLGFVEMPDFVRKAILGGAYRS